MRRADLAQLRDLVEGVVRQSSLGAHLRSVVLEPNENNEDDDLIRVIIEFDTLVGLSDDEMESLISSIEISVNDLDERFPSIRFAEAA